MGDSKLYTAHDVEKLKQKIATYKDTLTSLKTGSSIDGYLFIKNEFSGFKSQISHLEGLAEIMDVKQSLQIGEYEQQVKQFSVQINTLNRTVEELNQDISLLRNKIKNDTSNDLMEHVNAQAEVQDSEIIKDNEKRVDSLIEETTQTKDRSFISSILESNGPPSFMQLQSLVAKANSIQEALSDVAPVSNLAIQKKYPEEQQFSNKIFPSTGINPSQLFSGRNNNASMTSAIQLNKFKKKQRVPIRVIENPDLSSATSVFEKNEKGTEYFDEVNNMAPIEEVNTPIVVYDEVCDIAPIASSNEMKRQQHKNKETFWILNLFSKKH